MDYERDELQAFDPRQNQHRFRLWVRVVTPDGAYRHVFWRRVGVAAVLFCVAAWLAGAGGIWAFLRYGREWNDVSYSEVAFMPVRTREFRKALARHYVTGGLAEMEAKNFRVAYSYFVNGIRFDPANLQNRRVVAITLVRFGLLPRAFDVLTEGVSYGPDLEYLKLLFGWLHEAKADTRALQVARSLLPRTPDTSLIHRYVALQEATSHYALGEFSPARRLIQAWGLYDSLEGQILLARCDWDAGATDLALQRLEEQMARFSNRDELYLELIRMHRLAGHYDAARRYSLLRQISQPHSPGPRVDLLNSYRDADDSAALTREVATFLKDFAHDDRALALLAEFAAEAPDRALVDRVALLAEQQQFDPMPFRIARVKTALRLQEYRTAVALSEAPPEAAAKPARASGAAAGKKADELTDQELADRLEAGKKPEENAAYLVRKNVLEGLHVVALFGAGNLAEAEPGLKSFAQHARLPAADVIDLSYWLHQVAGPANAAALVRQTCKLDPFNEVARAELVRLDAEAADHDSLVDSVQLLIASERPPREALQEALLALSPANDASLIAKIRAALAAKS